MLSRFYAGRPAGVRPLSGLVLNYAPWDAPALREGVLALAKAIAAVKS